MKQNNKPTGSAKLIDSKPIAIPKISSSSEQQVTTAVIYTTSFSRSQVSLKRVMISRGTQTGDGADQVALTEKRRLIRKQLAVLLHAALCRVRDELLPNTGVNARPCSTALCGLMKGVLRHLRSCGARQTCTHPHCLSSRQILSHWKTCTQTDCQVCASLRRVVPAYLQAVVQNPRWRQVIMARFQWLITFVAPANFQMPTTPTNPTSTALTSRPSTSTPAFQQPQGLQEEEHERNSVKNSEE